MSLLTLPDDYLMVMGIWLAGLVVVLVVLLKVRRRAHGKKVLLGTIHAVLSLWFVLVCLTGIEVWYALFVDRSDSFNMTNISRRWFERHVLPQQKPLLFANGQGTMYRDDRAYPESVGDGQHHILFVGDSFTFGHGLNDVNDRFSNRVRARLERDHGDRFVVTNLADAGRDLHWVEVLLQSVFASGHKVDTVVYVMCLNDIETFHPRHRTYYNDLSRNNPTLWLFSKTYFFNFLYFRARQFTMPEISGYYSFVRDYYDGEPWERMQAKLTDVRDLCRDNDSELRLVVFPFLHSLKPDYPFAAAHERIMSWCDQNDVRGLDLTGVLSAHADDGLTVNPFDAHPSARAHEIAGNAIHDELLNERIHALNVE